jgi:hypothetical protein
MELGRHPVKIDAAVVSVMGQQRAPKPGNTGRENPPDAGLPLFKNGIHGIPLFYESSG